MSLKKTLSDARQRKNTRLRFIVLLAVVLVFLYLIGVIKKWFLIGLGIVLLAVFGIQMMDHDLDLGRLRETGNIQESRVQHTNKGVTLYGSCITSDFDLNCADFATQKEAQAKYKSCMDSILADNPNVTDLNKLDIYGLDGDKDGIVCEALPAN